MTVLTNVRSRLAPGGAAAFSTDGMTTIRGEVRFVSAEERTGLHGAITPRGLLAVEISDPPWFDAAPGRARRGKLRDAIEWAIESALEVNGAPPAGMSDAGDLDQDLSDQLFRARSIGARGLALYFPHLATAGSLAGALDAEDSAVLRWWMAATGERPVVLLLDSANRSIAAYGPPTRLERLVEAARPTTIVIPRAADEPVAATDDAPREEPSDLDAVDDSVSEPLARVEATSPLALLDASSPLDPAVAGAPTEAIADDAVAIDTPEHAVVTTLATEADSLDAAANLDASPETDVEAAPVATMADEVDPPDEDATTEPREPRGPPEPTAPPSPPVAALPTRRMFAERVVPLFPRRETLPAKSPAFVEKGNAVAASLDWRGFANELEVARGPKPLTIVERLFMSRYVPLVHAIVRGEADNAAKQTAERWAENFTRSYTEGFGALRITGKRPRMVLDAPQLCSQIARLHGAKSTQLVMVDAMRFDLGVRVHDRMRDALTSQATCTERLLLWSALPTTTPVQLDLLARGPEGLASPSPPPEREEPAAIRGRSSSMLRRIKVGGRDILKLDAVESRLRESGPALEERLDVMAEEVALALSAHARSLAPRTLMFVFADHGFRMESNDAGTLAGTAGGASPEEVLVPAFAWLVGDVH